MSIVLSAALPPGDRNGLEAIERALLDNPGQAQMVVAMVNCSKVTTTQAKDRKVVATARILNIEAFPYGSDGWNELGALLAQQREDRTGQVPLPLEDDPE